MRSALGEDVVGNISSQLGMPNEEAAGGLAAILPQLIDQLTPQGSLPDSDAMSGNLMDLAGSCCAAEQASWCVEDPGRVPGFRWSSEPVGVVKLIRPQLHRDLRTATEMATMARIHVDLPDQFPFSTEITLYLSHMNYGNHLDNAMFSPWFPRHLRFLKSMGYTELDVDGLGIIVADAALQYKSEGHHGETMRVEMTAAEFGKYGCDLYWRMSEAQSAREVARGKTGIVFSTIQRARWRRCRRVQVEVRLDRGPAGNRGG